MLFSKAYIKQVIKEETTNYFAMKKKLKKSDKGSKLEQLRKELIHLFIDFRDKATDTTTPNTKDPKKALEKSIENIKNQFGLNLDYAKFLMFSIHILDGKADPQLVNFIKNVARGDKRFEIYLDKLDNYGMSITPSEEKHQYGVGKDPDPGFMRVPKSDNAYEDQEDLRRGMKNYKQ
jgi:hypothetical protein